MADTSDAPPFVRHHRLAKALVGTLHEAIAPQLVAKGALSHAEFARAFSLLMENWPRVLPLFAHTCQTCLARRPPCADEDTRPGCFTPETPEGRRRDHVTRLLFSAVLASVPEARDPISGQVFPRVVVPGLQTNLAALFYEKEWEALNADALAVFQHIGTDRDEEVWPRLTGATTRPMLADALFVRVMLRFRQFHFQRQSFVRRMVEALREKRFTFTDEHFDTLFETMFGHLREELRTELGRARVDIRYGDDTSGHLLRIFDAFDKRRQEQELPIRTLGGAVRAPSAGRAHKR